MHRVLDHICSSVSPTQLEWHNSFTEGFGTRGKLKRIKVIAAALAGVMLPSPRALCLLVALSAIREINTSCSARVASLAAEQYLDSLAFLKTSREESAKT